MKQIIALIKFVFDYHEIKRRELQVLEAIAVELQQNNKSLANIKKSIKKMGDIQKSTEKLASCVDGSNHRGKNAITTGHWND